MGGLLSVSLSLTAAPAVPGRWGANGGDIKLGLGSPHDARATAPGATVSILPSLKRTVIGALVAL